jgi:xanthine dehydrogenase accessory factor
VRLFAAAAEAIRTGRKAAIATVISVNGSAPRSSGAKILVFADGDTIGTVGGGVFEYRMIDLARKAAVEGQPIRVTVHLTRDLGMCCGGEMEAYIEPLQVKAPMTIFGAGHIAEAVAPLLLALDYTVTIVDAREEYATQDRFPGCTVICTDPRAYVETTDGGEDEHWLIVTHDHPLDQDIGEVLLPKAQAWLGMIGSRAKIAKFRMRYRAAGLDDATIAKLRAPVGLDLGAETPAEIAVSICAELIRVRRRCERTPLPLSSTGKPLSRG